MRRQRLVSVNSEPRAILERGPVEANRCSPLLSLTTHGILWSEGLGEQVGPRRSDAHPLAPLPRCSALRAICFFVLVLVILLVIDLRSC
jgi:hypothetical protein